MTYIDESLHQGTILHTKHTLIVTFLIKISKLRMKSILNIHTHTPTHTFM